MSTFSFTPCLAHHLFTGCDSAFRLRFLVSFSHKWLGLRARDLATSLLSVTRRLPALLPTQPIKFPSTTGRSESLGRGTHFKSTSSRKRVPLPIPIILHYLGLTLTWVNWFTQWGGQGRVVVVQSRWDTVVGLNEDTGGDMEKTRFKRVI